MLERQRPLQGVRYMMYEINIVSENLRFVRLHEDDKRFQNLHPGDLRQFLVPEKEPRAARNEGVGFFATLLFCKHSIAKIRIRRILREKADCKQFNS